MASCNGVRVCSLTEPWCTFTPTIFFSPWQGLLSGTVNTPLDSRFSLSDDEHRTVAREAAALGYTSLWTPVAETRERFDVCVTWYRSSGLPTGVAVAPVSAWRIDELAAVSKALA